MSFPEPLCTAELNAFRVDRFDFFKSFNQSASGRTVFNAEGNVGDPVRHFGNGIRNRQGIQVMRILLAGVYKMPITALQCETIRQNAYVLRS